MIDAHELGNIDIIRRLIKGATDYVYVSNITSYVSTITGGAAIQGSGTYVQSTGTIQFVNSNGLTFGLSNNGVMTGSYTQSTHDHPYAGTGTSATNASITLNTNGLAISVAAPGAAEEYNYINLYGNTSNASTASGSSILLSGGNNITLAASDGSIKIEGGAGGGGVAIANSQSTFTSGTVQFRGTNVTISTSAGQYMDISAPAVGNVYFSNTNGITFGTSTNGVSTTVTGSINLGNVYFNDSNGITFGSSTSGVCTTITASVNAGGGGVAIKGSGTYSQSSGTVEFSNSNGVTFGLSNNGVMTASVVGAPNRSVVEIIPGEYLTRIINISATQVSNKILFNPFWLDGNGLIASTVRIIMSWVTNTTPPVMTYGAAIYKHTNSTMLTLINSTTATVNYATSQSASYSGIRAWDITGLTSPLEEGRHVLALYFSYGNTTNANASLYGASNWPAIIGYVSGASGTAATADTRHLYPFQGRYSATTAAFPNSVNVGDVYGGRSQDAFDFYAILKQI